MRKNYSKMEKRKESLGDIKLCRFCLTQDSTLTSLYDRSRDPIVTLPLKIMACVSIEVFPSDKMPSYICERCRAFMDLCYEFKQVCRRADESCLQFVQNGAAITAIKYPPSLTKIFNLTKKTTPSSDVQMEEALSSQEMSENDDEENESYNIKIGGSKAQKASGDKESSPAKKAAVSTGVLARPRRRSRGTTTWACDECDHSYRLYQLLQIHKAQKHRARKESCFKCDASFFSKYDLIIHQMRHSNETPYHCVACNRKFKRLILLKRHEQIEHESLPHFECLECDSMFLSRVELEAHKQRHELDVSRQHMCGICDRKFHKSETLRRHEDIMHGNKHFACEYCPERFSTTTKLVRHVRTHVERAYPCKYCNKSFIKSNHYSRHLRLKHEDEMRAAGNSNESEFRCEQCSETFGTQDELYYHSAIHATQNLICPLCQEKFENVDAVTSHIRTHVNGIEFMCDFCELVFTSKEKLDNHMVVAHDAEIDPQGRMDVDESSLEAEGAEEADADDDEEDNGLEVTEEEDHMVVKIQKTGGFMLRKGVEVGQTINTNSEDSDVIESPYPEIVRPVAKRAAPPTKSEATSSRAPAARSPVNDRISIVRKAEAIKRKVGPKEDSAVPQKKERAAKVDSTTNSPASTNDKSLRMLEKDLQDLKRTITRIEGKPVKAGEAKSKRLPVNTPKARSGDERKSQSTSKPTPVEKRTIERRQVTKDNKEAKESAARNTVTSSREDKNVSSTKDDKPGTDRQEKPGNNKDNDKKNAREELEKQAKGLDKEDRGKEAKSKPTKEDAPSSSNKVEASSSSKAEKIADKNAKNNEVKEAVKNGDTSSSEDSTVRRSTRPSKIKNYASMIRERTRMIRDEEDLVEDSDDDDDEDAEYMAEEAESRAPQRRSGPKRQRTETPTADGPPAEPRKRGRPRKDAVQKGSQDEAESTEAENESAKAVAQPEEPTKEPEVVTKDTPAQSLPQIESPPPVNNKPVSSPTNADSPPAPVNTVMSPTGQTLKKVCHEASINGLYFGIGKVPIQSLPPGVKPLPLPLNARRDLCQMQIGKKMVKVQKIVMTKAEVEDMAKKGLLELKGKTMVLKAGTKLPGEPTVVRSGLVSEGAMRKAAAATPTRCNLQGEDP